MCEFTNDLQRSDVRKCKLFEIYVKYQNYKLSQFPFVFLYYRLLVREGQGYKKL